MGNVMITVCDKNFFDYALNLFKSFKKFNSTPMYFGNIDCTEEQITKLKELGVNVKNCAKAEHFAKKRIPFVFTDFLVYDYLKDVDYNKVLWIDADTIVLKNIEKLFKIEAEFIGHPGRGDEALLTENNKPYIAFGTWVTNNKKLLETLSSLVPKHTKESSERLIFRKEVDKLNLKLHILDTSMWNYSRQEIVNTKNSNGKLYYEIEPFTIGFSRDDNGKRFTNNIIDKWIEDNLK